MSASHDDPVQVEGLTRRYGGLTAVKDLTFQVRRGEMFGLIGPDGAGKTTTLRVILGLLRPHGGRVSTCGLEPARNRRKLSERIGYLSQRFSLYGDLSVDENIAFFGEIHAVRGWRTRREELLEMLRMTAFRDRLGDRLSGGMRQKLALACTLIHTPELLVLDEPTTGVDPVSRRDFWKILVGLQRQGLTLLLTTPYLDEAERCEKVALLDRGTLLALDSPDHLRELPGGSTLELLASPRQQAVKLLRDDSQITEIETFGERLHLRLQDVPVPRAGPEAERISRLLEASGVRIQSLRVTSPTLEDVFIAKIREVRKARPHEETQT